MAIPPSPRGLQPNEPAWQMRVLNPYGAADEAVDNVVGGAVLLSPRLLVTCAHVVNTALGRHQDAEEHPGAGTTVRLRSFDDRVWEAEVRTDLWSAGPLSRDLALLHLLGPGLPDTDFPVLSGCADLDRGQALYTTGYPEHMRSLQASMTYQGKGGPNGVTHQIEIPPSRLAQVTGGFSGCAVRSETGELVGLVQKNHQYVWNAPDEPSGIVFILPVEEVLGEREGGERVSVQRLTDESLCGKRTYDRLHDLLDSIPLEAVPPEALLRSREMRRVRQQGAATTAWRVLTALWDLVPQAGRPPLRVAWVHHVYREISPHRPVPQMVWQWIRDEASVLGSTWAEALVEDRDERLRGPGGPAPLTHPETGPDEPDTMVFFDLEPVTGGFNLSHGFAHRGEGGGRPLHQETRLVREPQICDEIGDLMSEVVMRRLVTPNEESLRLRVFLPRNLLHLRLGQATGTSEVQFPPRLGSRYEIVYHIRERHLNPSYLGTPPDRWRLRSEEQREKALVGDPNVLLTWEKQASEVADALTRTHLTVCAVDSETDDAEHVYDSAVVMGVPTIIKGPKKAVLGFVTELLEREPRARVRITALARTLRDRAQDLPELRDVSLIHDDYGDVLAGAVLDGGSLGPGAGDPHDAPE
ncbi:trypsin-like peptidase domain-containing protein [Nocardiopsis sp. NPDC058631]|uniref:trypsin-like peptidase domain-containing protein n=1 Tax=Nocardiopsis sp. NPDC058631 TaxID=3346566 RepID=UPI0036649A9C